MTTTEADYGHALRNLQSTIYLSHVNLDKKGNVTSAGRRWLADLLETFGFNPMMIPKLRPEYRELAQEIIDMHSDKPLKPSLYHDILADDGLLNDTPDYDIE